MAFHYSGFEGPSFVFDNYTGYHGRCRWTILANRREARSLLGPEWTAFCIRTGLTFLLHQPSINTLKMNVFGVGHFGPEWVGQLVGAGGQLSVI